jgi:CheY-like chemotaxis protein
MKLPPRLSEGVEEMSPTPKIQSPMPLPTTNGSSSKPLHFLVVDDSMATRKVVHRLLTRERHKVTEASDGQDCLVKYDEAMARGSAVDVVLMDDNMPNMNGPEATKALRDRGYKGIICAVTGNTLSEDVKHFMKQGATAVLSKPLDLALLQECIAKNI